MASRQFQLDEETYINADDNSREFQVDAQTYFIEEVAAGNGDANLAAGSLSTMGVGN